MNESPQSSFPGTSVPNREKDPEGYERYWRALALWAYKWGPVFIDLLKGAK